MTERSAKLTRFGGGPAHERLLLANLAAALIARRSIKTTETKARRLRPLVERLIAFAKRGDLHARRRVQSVIGDKEAVHILFTEIAPLVADREGGYTRITKVGNRKGDNAAMVVVELALEPVSKRRRPASRNSDSSDGDVEHVTVPPAYLTQARVLCEFFARNRDELSEVAEAIDLRVFGYGHDDRWLLASRLLRDIVDEPATLELTRVHASDRALFQVRVSWIGDEPDVTDVTDRLKSVVGIDSLSVRRRRLGPLDSEAEHEESAAALDDLGADAVFGRWLSSADE